MRQCRANCMSQTIHVWNSDIHLPLFITVISWMKQGIQLFSYSMHGWSMVSVCLGVLIWTSPAAKSTQKSCLCQIQAPTPPKTPHTCTKTRGGWQCIITHHQRLKPSNFCMIKLPRAQAPLSMFQPGRFRQFSHPSDCITIKAAKKLSKKRFPKVCQQYVLGLASVKVI